MVIPFFYLDSITIGAIVAFFKLPVLILQKTKINIINERSDAGEKVTSPPIPHPSPLDLLPIENKNIVIYQSKN